MNLFKRLRGLLDKLTFSNAFLIILILINILPVLAPILMAIGWTGPAKIIYLIFSFTCHQMHERSIHLFGYQVAWCARDWAIWLGMLLVTVSIKLWKLQGLKWYQVLPFVIPIAMDGIIQTFATLAGYQGDYPLYISNNFSRVLTGGLFGVGLGVVLIPMVTNLEFAQTSNTFYLFRRKLGKRLKLHISHVIIAAYTLVILTYMLLVQIWQITSPNYLPTNIIDSEIKFPKDGILQIERRKNGVCPVRIDTDEDASFEEFINLECFF
jgi:uncharacterized membrane protein